MITRDEQDLAERVEAVLGDASVTTRRMFGGITFLLDGNMLCCVSQKGLMVRVGAAAEPHALESLHARPCLGAGRRMAGFLMVEPSGLATEKDLSRWIQLARTYVSRLPPKAMKNRHQHDSPRGIAKSGKKKLRSKK